MRTFFTISFLLLFYHSVFSQITVSQTGTVAQWVQNVLVGPGITVSNVSYTGDALSIGTFTTGASTTNLGFSSGIILSSGKASDAAGVNNSGSQTYNSTGGSDANLAALINTTTPNIKDACVLEFDFIPVSDTVRFRYVFGSEEYAEFVNSSFNDVFGFFVSGINPLGGFYSNKNIALIPNTNTAVSINNVNNGTTNSGPCVNCAYYTNNTGGIWVQYDGLTVVLTAWVKVIPCFTYHIKLAIADVADEAYDSGVFLEANSFMSNSVVIDQSTSNTIDTSAIEGCNDAIITFRIPHPISTNTIINYLPTGTATNGVDYTYIPNQVVIPAGLDSVNLVIHPILDGIAEPFEYIRLIVNTSSCTYDTVMIYIKDNSATQPALPPDTVLCGSSTIPITVNATGGYSPYTYLWSTGDTTQQISVSPIVSTTYYVTVTDLCQNDSTVSMLVKVSEPDFDIFGDTICLNQSAVVRVVPKNPLTYSWNTGATTAQITVQPIANQAYQVRVTDTLGCFIDTSAVVVVNPLPQIMLSPPVSLCLGESTTITVNGGLSYKWNTGSTDSVLSVTPPSTKTYSVTATNSLNCKSDSSVTIEIFPVPDAIITSTSDTICRGSTATLTATGGDFFLWNNGSTDMTLNVTPEVSSTYSVVASYVGTNITCSDSVTFTQAVKRCNRFYVSNAFSPNNDNLNETFGPEGIFENIDHYSMSIFDRWGRLIFHSSDPFVRWDGTIDGEKALGGVYVYHIVVQETFSEEYLLVGTLHLIR